MRKSTLLIISLICFIQFSNAQDKKVLFIGNSYTFMEDIPNMFYQVANSTGDLLIVDSETNGGADFEFHATEQVVTDKINSDNWDYVVLQGQSVEVGLTGDYFNNNVAPFAAQLVQTIKANNSCTQTVFYNTWGRENGMGAGGPTCTTYPWMCTYEGMDDALAQNYRVLADSHDGIISPVGQVWRYIRDNWSDIDLYIADQSHQTLEGAYASACTFYATILRKDPLLITYNAGLDEFDAGRIRNAVKVAVYDQLETWKIGEYDTKSEFTYSDIGNEVTFKNASENVESYSWDFGDSNSSMEENPIHTYNEAGNYTVTLTVEKCGQVDSYQLDVNISTLELENTDFDSIKMIPNPSNKIISFKGLNSQDISSVVIYSLEGKKITSKINFENLDISSLKYGTYFVEIITKNGSVAVKKLIKN